MILIIVYVGAVAVLFLFVVMLLDVDFAGLRQGFVGISAAAELLISIGGCDSTHLRRFRSWPFVAGPQPRRRRSGTLSNTAALGEVLYTRYFYFFQASGMILLTAMIGAIVLTLHHKPGVKRQDVGVQVARTPETAIEVRKVPSRAGI